MIASMIIEEINYLCYIAVILYRNDLASVRVSLSEINYYSHVKSFWDYWLMLHKSIFFGFSLFGIIDYCSITISKSFCDYLLNIFKVSLVFLGLFANVTYQFINVFRHFFDCCTSSWLLFSQKFLSSPYISFTTF